MNQFSYLLEQLGIVLEADTIPRFLEKISIERSVTLEQFELAELSYKDHSTHRYPEQTELDQSAQIVIRWAQRKAIMVGGLGGFGGLLTAIPENAAYLVQVYRLTQRIMLLYDLNHRDDDLIAKALLFAHQTDTKADENWLVNQAKKQAPALIGSLLIKQGRKIVGTKAARYLPGIGAGIGAMSSYRSIGTIGERVNLFFTELELGNPYQEDIEEAEEI